ncbi:MAG: hypothetical protein ACUVS1_08625 [Actinomycetota bacterium]
MGDTCPTCGVPTIITRTHRWNRGCIVNRAGAGASFSLYEASFHNGVFQELEKQLGPTINRMVYIAGRVAAAEIARNLFTTRPLLQKLLYRSPLYRWTQHSLIRFTRAIGMGRIEFLGHRKGKQGAVRVTDPFHLAHRTAVILGGLDVMYGFPVSFTARVEGESYVGVLVPGGKDALGSEDAYIRLTPEPLIPEPDDGWVRFRSCARCGAPLELAENFSFDLQRGVIVERETGDRHIFYGHQSLHAILREFEVELGPEVGDLFVGAEKEGFATKLSACPGYGPSWKLEDLRSYLALRGMGLLSRLEEKEGGASLEVRNAFVPTMVVGRLAALWERHAGEPATLEYEMRGNTLQLELTAAP